MDFLPIFLNVRERSVLVVGGGEVAARKISLLIKAQARIRVVAPELCPALQALQQKGSIGHEARGYAESDLDNCDLVFAATSDSAVNPAITSGSAGSSPCGRGISLSLPRKTTRGGRHNSAPAPTARVRTLSHPPGRRGYPPGNRHLQLTERGGSGYTASLPDRP